MNATLSAGALKATCLFYNDGRMSGLEAGSAIVAIAVLMSVTFWMKCTLPNLRRAA